MGLYAALEERYYAFLDWLDEHGIPLWKLIQPIESRGIPSFPVFIVLVVGTLIAIGWWAYALLFGPKVYLITVLDPSGSPVGGAKVLAEGELVGITGPDGTLEAELKEGTKIWVRAEGFKDAMTELSDRETQIILEPEVREARIMVTDTGGRPVDARVTVYGADGMHEFQGADVRFNVSKVPVEGAVAMGKGLSLRVEVTAEGYDKAVTTITWDAPATTVRLRKPAPPTATVYVLAEPAVNGWAYLVSGVTTVDQAIMKGGKATFRGVTFGIYTLRVVPVIDGEKYDSPDNTFELRVDMEEVTKRVFLTLPDVNQLLSTTIRVLDANTGNPVEASVFIHETNATYTAHRGVLRLKMKKKEVIHATVSARKYFSKDVEVRAGQDVNVYLERAPAVGNVLVTVKDIHGVPVQGATVVILDLNEHVVAEANAPTDDEGHVLLTDVGVGKYVAESCKGSVCARSKEFQVEEDRTAEVEVTLVPGYATLQIHLTVDGVPSAGRARAVRISTGEVLAEAEIDIGGNGEMNNVPAYVGIRVEVEAQGIKYVTPRMRLLPNETRLIEVNIATGEEEGFQILGVYRGEKGVGMVEAGKEYDVRVAFTCRDTCEENFTIENGVFLDTDWPGDYFIGDGDSSAAEGNVLAVSLTCDGLCTGTFDVRIRISETAAVGERMEIRWDDTSFWAPIAWEGICNGDLCAYARFKRGPDVVDPMDLYEELNYSLMMGILWGGEDIANAKLVVEAVGPATAYIYGKKQRWVFRGRLERGAMVNPSGWIRSEDPGYESIVITVSTCDPTYVNCQDVASMEIPAYFNPEPAGELTIVPSPEAFFSCDMEIQVRLYNDEGLPVTFDPETMIAKAFGVDDKGFYTALPVSADENGLTVSVNGADFEQVEITVDGFGYAEAETYVYKEDPTLTPVAYPENVTVDVEDELQLAFSNDSSYTLVISSIVTDLPGLAVEVIADRGGCVYEEANVEPGQEAQLNLRVTDTDENYYGQDESGTVTVEFHPYGFPDCTFRSSAPATYTILPNCIEVNANATANAKVKVSLHNRCQAIGPDDVQLSASSRDIPVITCSPVGPPNPGATVTTTCEPDTSELNTGTYTVKVRVMSTYEDGMQEADQAITVFFWLGMDGRGVFTFLDSIDPNTCGWTWLEYNVIPAGRVSPPDPDIAWLNGLKLVLDGKEYVYYVPGYYRYNQEYNKATGRSSYNISSTLATDIDTPGQYYVEWDANVGIVGKKFWYDPFPLSGNESANVRVFGLFSDGYYGPWTYLEINQGTVTLEPLDIKCEGGYLDVNTCAPVAVGLGGRDITGIVEGNVDVDLLASTILGEGSMEDTVNKICNGEILDTNVYLVRSSSVDSLGCAAENPYLLVERNALELNVYPIVLRASNEWVMDGNIHSASESLSPPADGPRIVFQALATGAGLNVYVLKPLGNVSVEENLLVYTGDSWQQASSPYIDLTGAGYHHAALLASANTQNCTQDSGDPVPKAPAEIVLDSGGNCVFNEQAHPVEEGASPLYVWGYGEVTDCQGLADAGITAWYYQGPVDSPAELLAFNYNPGGEEVFGYITKTTADDLNLIRGIHYEYGTHAVVEDVAIDVNAESNTVRCIGDANLYAVFWTLDSDGYKSYVQPGDGEYNALFICVPTERDGLPVYDYNLFNNVAEVNNVKIANINVGVNAPCLCSLQCGGDNVSLSPGEETICEEDGCFCYYVCEDGCTLRKDGCACPT